ncbi:hypothetical protein MJ585_26370 [Klebsiella pneumoniae]|nr:hypothetical protein MJ585_26370 [Klebsiella pneumoniae]
MRKRRTAWVERKRWAILAKVDEPLNVEGKTPFVILMVGVKRGGETTTIGKLARQFEQQVSR